MLSMPRRFQVGFGLVTTAAATVMAAQVARADGRDGAADATAPGADAAVKTSVSKSTISYPPLQSATRIPARSTAMLPPKATGVLIGERWGCASYDTGSGTGYQCWDAGAAPRARRVPWMDGQRFETAPEHLCAQEAPPGLKFRCWKRPVPGERKARPLAEGWQWLNPHGATWEDIFNRADRVEHIDVGATFSCLHTTKGKGVFCLGDDQFGQRGGSVGAPRPEAERTDPAFVQDVWPAMFMAVGFWHACALHAPWGMSSRGDISCWGRGDAGQLGIPASPPDVCRVDGQDVACARTPVSGIKVAKSEMMMTLGAGDLFTCLTNEKGISCWGGSRDAIFGVPGTCPDSLRRAWPTLRGPVPAPNASCSAVPLPLPGATQFNPHFTVRPRAVCFDQDGAETCFGGLPKPRDPPRGRKVISPGSDASACTVADGHVYCWGEAYSPAHAPGTLVEIALESTVPIGETAVVRFRTRESWADKHCLVHRGCPIGAPPLPRCPKATSARGSENDPTTVRRWAQLEPQASKFEGQTVSVRGPLGVGPIKSTLKGCSTADGKSACCNGTGGSILVGGGVAPLSLSGLACRGDDSQACCNAPAYGQTVVASGVLTALPEAGPREPRWMLNEPKLCAE